MNKIERYRIELREQQDWDDFLLRESGLPGPRGNLELAKAAALDCTREDVHRWLSYTPEAAPANTPGEFLAFCGVLGLGKLICLGEVRLYTEVRRLANDPRWRTREAVAMALQAVGMKRMDEVLRELEGWMEGTLLELRAAAAGLCEPILLKDKENSGRVIQILNKIMERTLAEKGRRGENFRTLRQGLGYCWSVAVATDPSQGMPALEKYVESPDLDIRWIMRENLKKQRLIRLDKEWTAAIMKRLNEQDESSHG